MCGIAGFVSDSTWKQEFSGPWIGEALSRLAALDDDSPTLFDEVDGALSLIEEHFDDLMSFGLHFAIVRGGKVGTTLERVQAELIRLEDRLQLPSVVARDRRAAQRALERTRDYLWQVRYEAFENVERTTALLPAGLDRGDGADRATHFVAWSIEQVLENIDRLEVRGRDSAGFSVLLLLPEDGGLEGAEAPALRKELDQREQADSTAARRLWRTQVNGRLAVQLAYKVAGAIGRLGDNTARLRDMIRGDDLLWALARSSETVNVLAHTRWASNGVISVPNTHPVDAGTSAPDGSPGLQDRGVQFVLNGDVDNCSELLARLAEKGRRPEGSVTTDAKVPPLLFRFHSLLGLNAKGDSSADSPAERFGSTVGACDGSLALVMQHPHEPEILRLAQKGSGQSLFASRVRDGWIVSSEVYGVAARARNTYALSGLERGGMNVALVAAGESSKLSAQYVADGSPATLAERPIEIYSRDIFRGDHAHYLEKELFEAPGSIRKTLANKYELRDGQVRFVTEGPDSFEELFARLRDPSRRPVDEVLVIGQGTASIAAMGIAHLIERALEPVGVRVSWEKSSEVSGFAIERSLESMLVVAVSQSGTTTDTNRTVDLLSSCGAWVHAIVNRRDSALVMRSHSHTYTSDGRDVEMAVASTKAFYSQIAAGKVLALFLAHSFHAMGEKKLLEEVHELESLPQKVGQVLEQSRPIQDCAIAYGPSSLNWALVGNGPNRIAAEEIRIKLSELCYKSIPCDVTEDKKHIDLSTEPLTMVVAVDLPELLVQDTVKEVAIFKAHGGKPIVICVEDENSFDECAQAVLSVPGIGGGLGFVLAAVIGHVWGYHAAMEIDNRAVDLRRLRLKLTSAAEGLEVGDSPVSALEAELGAILDQVSAGAINAAIKPSTATDLARYAHKLSVALAAEVTGREIFAEGVTVLTAAIEELTRPIDSIRHQAKTVTVGTSRPQRPLAEPLLDTFEAFGCAVENLKPQDVRQLRIVTPLVEAVEGAMMYRVIRPAKDGLNPGSPPLLQAGERIGSIASETSSYDHPKAAAGTKRTVMRLQHLVWSAGRSQSQTLLFLPVFGSPSEGPSQLLLMHLRLSEEATLDEKFEVLRRLGTRYDELLEQLEELEGHSSVELIVSSTSARELIVLPLAELVQRLHAL